MKFPGPLTEGVLLRRYKRFLADVRLPDGTVVVAHCANTGSMRSCAEPGWPVWLSHSDDPKRKLAWSWEVVLAEGVHPTLINTARPNRVVQEAIEQGLVPALRGYPTVRAEVPIGPHSRADLCLEGNGTCWIEVKNVTLHVGGGVAAFPDAVTSRGRKHLGELTQRVARGERAVQFFLVPRQDVEVVRPADEIDPEYGRALRDAARAGVEIMAWQARVDRDEVVLSRPLPVER